MELLAFGVNPWSSCCWAINRYYSGIRVRKRVGAAALPSPVSSSSSSKSNYFFDDDDIDSDEEKKQRQREEEKAAELTWATRARELAIQEMRSRNFNDRHFEALLPPHLRLSTQLRKKKKQMRMQARQQQLRPPQAAPMQKKKSKKKEVEIDEEDEDDVEREAVDPRQLTALARKFNEPLDRLLGREVVYGDDDDDEKKEPQTKLSVVYNDKEEEEPDSEKDATKKPPVDDPRRGFILNRDLADARDVDEVLEAMARVKGKLKLSPVNISTALHRIAKNMVKVSMVETRRLIYARQPEVCELVASAMELLPESSAQGISNVAWALSKIGGSLLYYGEMEAVAMSAMSKVEEMNAQNVANIAGAFASMQHSNPALFQKLAERGSEVAGELKPQELAQLLWSFACLNQPAGCLLDALDQLELPAKLESSDAQLLETEDNQEPGKQEKFSFELLSNIAWSCAVLGQLHRPFFRRICGEIHKFDENASVEQHQRRHLTQLYQVMMALKVEGNKRSEPISFGEKLEKFAAAAWGKEKSSRKKVSAFQREMQTFLAYTEKKWSREYENADYSVDFAVRDERVALEVNGPSHYARNTGELLGHTALKHRLLSASGWRVISASYADWENLDGEAEHIEFIHNLVAPYFQLKERQVSSS